MDWAIWLDLVSLVFGGPWVLAFGWFLADFDIVGWVNWPIGLLVLWPTGLLCVSNGSLFC